MNRRNRMFWLIGALSALVFTVPHTAAAQKLVSGTWTGTVAPPGDAATPVTYDVKVSGDSTAMATTARRSP